MSELGDSLGVKWAVACAWEQSLWTPADGLRSVPLRFTYSTEGPQHLELLEGAPGSVWDGRRSPGVHHVGVWVADLVAETEALLDDGWAIVGAAKSPAEGYGGFTYVAPPCGPIVELVDDRARERFESWWSGASLR